jgi:DNA repair protein RadC
MNYTSEDDLLRAALFVAEKRLHHDGDALQCPHAVRDYLKVWAAQRTEEHFGVIWLNSLHQVLATEVLFHGTIDGAQVYPRALLRDGLNHNAAAALVFHNHPSGDSEPSAADRALTGKLKEALGMIDIRLLDHLVVGSTITSLAERGWM